MPKAKIRQMPQEFQLKSKSCIGFFTSAASLMDFLVIIIEVTLRAGKDRAQVPAAD
jgi:hypothetical protein